MIKILYIVFYAALIITLFLFIFLGKEWAQSPFFLCLAILSIFNLFLNLKQRKSPDKKD